MLLSPLSVWLKLLSHDFACVFDRVRSVQQTKERRCQPVSLFHGSVNQKQYREFVTASNKALQVGQNSSHTQDRSSKTRLELDTLSKCMLDCR